MMRILATEYGFTVNYFGDKESATRHRLSFLLMIALVRGTLLEKHPNQAIVEAGCVGYDLTIPVSTYTGLPNVGAEVRLRVHTHVREDALALFGFLTQDEKTMFEKLIGVTGIGPKLAVTILSGLAAPDLINALRNGAIEQLVRIPGVGKKTAERMVLELRDKMVAVAATSATPAAAALNSIEEDVLSALLNLGSARPNAEAAVRKAKAAGAPQLFEPLFRKSLEFLR
jgi:Holliday junction DNA helicase RuvA